MQSTSKLALILLAAGALAAAGCSGKEAAGTPGPSGTAAPSSSAEPADTTAAASATPASTVKGDAVASLAFPAAAASVAPGKSLTLAPKAFNAKKEAVSFPDKSALHYTSDKPDLLAVDANGTVKPGPKAGIGTNAVITAEYKGKTASVTVKVMATLEETVTVSGGKSVVTNQNDIAVVVNKKRALPDNYAPDDLTEPQVPFSFNEKLEKRKLRKEAAQALEKLFSLASKDGIKLYGVSGYRSYATQKSVYNGNVQSQGKEAADKVSAQPGFSEHQTGLAIDVSSASAKFALEESFGGTAEGKWLAAHAHEAGFIIRYPKGKESVTGYSYEPWHIRYVGLDIAKEIFEKKWTLEEYFQDAVPVNR
ncbi:M15 family metallopeptidase [Gorillibacterium sp. sgz5001074]|uniref:M15 family metallopeptidase n=1 Tax=Gorillibacterium sp. sgz5001074 TaxID=3446695 RepID=UPI003F66794E